MIAATADQSTGIFWHASNDGITGATGTALGTGSANTIAIIALYETESNAAKLCDDYTNNETGTGVYSDWFLPSKDELNKLYLNRAAISVFAEGDYRSSSEISATQAWYQSFENGDQSQGNKSFGANVRAVRAF